MSHSGWSGTNRISALAGTLPSAVPMTLHIRYKAAAVNINSCPISVFTSGSSGSQYCRILISTAAVVNAQANGSSSASAAISANTWYSLCGVFTTNSSRTIYVDGSASAANTTAQTPSAFDSGAIGTRGDTIFPATNCNLAEAAIWNVTLTAEEIAALVEVSPLLIRPASLVSYVPLLSSGGIDFVAGPPTVGGTLTKDNDHPRVILPRQRSLIIPKSAGGGGEEQAVGSSAGSATAAATGQSTARASSTIAGTSTVAATGRSTAAAVGNAAGSSTAAATGTYTGEVQAVGTAAGTSSASAVGTSTGGTTTDTHDGFGYGDPFRRKRRPKKGKREKAVEDLLKKLMGLVPDDPPPAIEAEAEIAQASVERLFAPTVDVTPNLEALQFAQLQLAKLEAMLNRYLEDEEDDDDLLLMAA